MNRKQNSWKFDEQKTKLLKIRWTENKTLENLMNRKQNSWQFDEQKTKLLKIRWTENKNLENVMKRKEIASVYKNLQLEKKL